MKTYLQQMMFGLEDEKSKEAMKDYLIWKEKLQMSQSLTIRDLFKYLKLFIGDLPFDYEIEYYQAGEGSPLFDSSYISFRDIHTYYAIIKPKQISLKNKVILKISYDMLHLYSVEGRNILIIEFIELYQKNYLRKPNIMISEAILLACIPEGTYQCQNLKCNKIFRYKVKKMKEFSEEFPSLKDEEVGKCFGNATFKQVGSATLPEIILNANLFSEKEILKHCLDKQRVKEAIEKLTEKVWDIEVTPEEYFVNVNNLKKELGL